MGKEEFRGVLSPPYGEVCIHMWYKRAALSHCGLVSSAAGLLCLASQAAASTLVYYKCVNSLIHSFHSARARNTFHIEVITFHLGTICKTVVNWHICEILHAGRGAVANSKAGGRHHHHLTWNY